MAEDKSQILLQNIQKMFSNNNVTVTPEKEWLKKRNKKGPSKHELELAAAVILVDLASCDQHFDPAEYEVIVNGLRRVFGTQRHEVKALVNEAMVMLSGMRGPTKFAELLRDNLPVEQKQAVMDIIDETIMADNSEDGFETYLRHRFAEMLGMKH